MVSQLLSMPIESICNSTDEVDNAPGHIWLSAVKIEDYLPAVFQVVSDALRLVKS